MSQPKDAHDHHHHHHHAAPPASGDRAWPQAESEDERAVQALLVAAGYDPADAGAFRQGTAAYLAAQMLALSTEDPKATRKTPGSADAPPPERTDPCPCGSGQTYERCCLERDERVTGQGFMAPSMATARLGVAVETIPRTDPETLLGDNSALAQLFLQDPDLRGARFPGPALSAFLEHADPPPGDTDPLARDTWFRQTGHDFLTAQYEQQGDESEAVRAVLGLKARLLAAATRLAHRPDDLRAIALGLLYHSVFSPTAETPSPLTALLFRLALYDTAQEQQVRAGLLQGIVADTDAAAARLAAGDREALDAWQVSFDALPSEERSQLIQRAEAFHGEVQDAITQGSFPVPLPLASVLPLLTRTLHALRQAPEGSDEALQAAREASTRVAREGLSPEDRSLYRELCDDWLSAAQDQGASDKQVQQVRYARGMANAGPSSLEPLLLLGFLDHHQVSPLLAEPSPDPEEGADLDSPAFLARYASFLEKRGQLALALRTYQLCELAGEVPTDVPARILALDERLSKQN